MNQQSKQTGFTLIEIMLAMVFISVILLLIALTVIQMGSVYSRGLLFTDINKASRGVSDDLRRTAGSSERFVLSPTGADTDSFVTVKSGTTVVGGRLCMGTYSYIWNTGQGIEQQTTPAVREILAQYPLQPSESQTKLVQFIKVKDPTKQYCVKDTSRVGQPPLKITVPLSDLRDGTELLTLGDRFIAVWKLTVKPVADDPGRQSQLYRADFAIGSGTTAAMLPDFTACLPPRLDDPTYDASAARLCNVQQFTVMLTTGN